MARHPEPERSDESKDAGGVEGGRRLQPSACFDSRQGARLSMTCPGATDGSNQAPLIQTRAALWVLRHPEPERSDESKPVLSDAAGGVEGGAGGCSIPACYDWRRRGAAQHDVSGRDGWSNQAPLIQTRAALCVLRHPEPERSDESKDAGGVEGGAGGCSIPACFDSRRRGAAQRDVGKVGPKGGSYQSFRQRVL